MTSQQLRTVNMAASWAKKNVPDFDDAQWRLVLRNIGQVQADGDGHVSSKALSNSGMEQVMAWFESVGYRQGGSEPGYWTAKAARYSRYQVTDREIRMIEELASQQPYELAGIIGRLTNHRTTDIQQLSAHGSVQSDRGAQVDRLTRRREDANSTETDPPTDAGGDRTNGGRRAAGVTTETPRHREGTERKWNHRCTPIYTELQWLTRPRVKPTPSSSTT